MPFEPISPEKISVSIIKQIEQLILRGILRPGERLPSERELAERMDVSRPSLRSALLELQEKGLLTAKAGSGVFVADVLGSAFSDSLISLFANHDEALFDYLDFRADMEALAAERAARYGSETDIAVIRTIFDKMEAAHKDAQYEAEAALDAQFHMAILEASHNVVLLHMMRSMFDLLKSGVFYNRMQIFKQSMSTDTLLEQHRAILEAIEAHDPALARKSLETHIDYVRQNLTERRKAEKHDALAKRRLGQEQSRK